MAATAIRYCDPMSPTPYQVRHPSGVVMPVGDFELDRIGDADISTTKELARSKVGEWVPVPVPYSKPKSNWGRMGF
jgi:hypothetical protein